jgi:HTH-type transcriptional regulator / antitoxin HipB
MQHVLLTTMQAGQLLQSARKAAGMSQEQLAARVGIGQSRLSKLEQNAGGLTLKQLLALCGALRLELSVGPKPDSGSPTGSEW